ncbi:MAG: SRPBCC domain-containing protein [Candidatus Kapaibacterium sp.]|nr:SRPBCC domain-containing protein [Candidatus Kapabacteria bacterium]
MSNNFISIEAEVQADIKFVWECWNNPEHITKWNFASDDWHCPSAENNLKVGGSFKSRMEAKDGSFGFDFGGIYDEVDEYKLISYTMGDGRRVRTTFESSIGKVKIISEFEAEQSNSLEMQQMGWQAILNNFKHYVESEYFKKTTLYFRIEIIADSAVVYRTMLGLDDKSTYNKWTDVFDPSSNFEGSWESGTKMYFIGQDQDGNKHGMISEIIEHTANEKVTIKHIGLVNGNIEITEGEEVEKWKGCLESYKFTENDGKTLVSVSLDTPRNYKEYFEKSWAAALDKLKALCEENN